MKVRLTEAWLTLAEIPKDKRIGLSVFEEPEPPAEVEAKAEATRSEYASWGDRRVPDKRGIQMYYGGVVKIRCVLARSASATLRVIIEPDGMKH